MDDPCATEYAQCGDAYVAYRRCGTGPVDVVLIADWFSHVEEMWSAASPLRGVLEQLASFSRLVTFDRRGVGLSDPVSLQQLPTLEEWMDDVTAVLDACDIRDAAVVGKGAGGAMAMLFAASHPERVSSLVLVNSYARLRADDDYLIGLPADALQPLLRDRYPAKGSARVLAGGAIDDATVAWWDRYLRLSASPSTALSMRRMLFDVDVRAVLPSIQTPTLVLHRREDPWIRVEHGRYLTERIPNARIVELPGASDLLFAGDPSELIAEIEEFLTGSRPNLAANRALATVMYTDLVGSTNRAAQHGDQAWRIVLDQFETAERSELRRFQGREINTSGDGFLAVFDGPARAIRCADSIQRALGLMGLDVRAGLHTGEVELRGQDISGIAVHIGARIQALAAPREILVSRTVKDLVAGSGIRFEDRGVHALKGVPEEWQLYAAKP